MVDAAHSAANVSAAKKTLTAKKMLRLTIPQVVGGGNHFMSAYRRFFDNPESHLFPTDYMSSPLQAAAAAAAQRGGGGFESPSRGSPRALGVAPPTFETTNLQTHKEFPPEFLHQHPLRAFTTSGFSSLTQDRCYRTAPAHGVPVPRDCPLADGLAYIRDGTGGYIIADTPVDPVKYKSVRDSQQAHDHMFGALQVADEAALFGSSQAVPVQRRAQNLPPVGSGFVTTSSAVFKDPSLDIARLNDEAQRRTAAVVLDGSVARKRELAYTLPGIFHRINGIPTIVREKEVMYQMRVAKGQIQTPPRAKVTSISLEHAPFSVPVAQ